MTDANQVGIEPTIMNDMQQLLKSAWDVRAVAEARAQEARQELVRVAQTLCAAQLDQRRGDLTTKDLADLIIREAGQQNDELAWLRSQQASGNQVAEAQIGELQIQVKTLEAERVQQAKDLAEAHARIEQLQRANEGYEQEVTRLRLELQSAAIRTQLEQVRVTPTVVSEDGTPIPAAAARLMASSDWLEEWSRSRTFSRESGFIQLLGSTLECRREDLIKIFAARFGQEHAPGGALREIISRLDKELGLINQIKVSGAQAGEPPRLVQLSAKGCDAFHFLVNRDPLMGYDILRARHVNDQQVYLVLETKDILELDRYVVDLQSATTQLPEGRFEPDLIATRGHERICVEVETGAEYKNVVDRQKKWRIMAAGTGGQIYVVTRTEKSMKQLRGEIQDQRYERPVTLHLTNLEQVREHLDQKHTLWMIERAITV